MMKRPDLRRFLPEKPPAITDPVAHAAARTGKTFSVAASAGAWEAYASFVTTGEFRDLDDGYRRHCGPTAITNLLMAFENRKPLVHGKRMSPARVFSRVAKTGMRRRYFWNTDFLGLYGGTVNMLLSSYIRRAFALYRRTDYRILGSFPAWPFFLERAIDRGSLLYTELVLHPLYGNHHVIVYGYRKLRAPDGTTRLYLATADGWSGEMRYLDVRLLRISRFLELAQE